MKAFVKEMRMNGDVIMLQGGKTLAENITIIDTYSDDEKEDLAQTFKFSSWSEMKEICGNKVLGNFINSVFGNK